MDKNDVSVMMLALERLREVNDVLDEIEAGVCVIHLDACIASMESRVLKVTGGSLPRFDGGFHGAAL